MRRTLLLLATSAAIVVSGCSSGGLQPVKVAGGGLCESYVATAAVASPGPARTDWLDKSIRTCRSLEQWQAAVARYAASALGAGATEFLTGRCTDAGSGLSGYQLCGLLAISLATPTPAPTKKTKKKPKKTAKPSPKRTPAPAVLASPAPSAGGSITIVVPSPGPSAQPLGPPAPLPSSAQGLAQPTPA